MAVTAPPGSGTLPTWRTTTEQATADLAGYRQSVFTLSNPFMEGRGPGTRGNRLAAEYLEWHFQQIGLEPAFDAGAGGDGAEGGRTFMHEFAAGREVKTGDSRVGFAGGGGSIALEPGRDFTVLGNSGSTTAEGEIAFVGYSLPPADPDNPRSDGVGPADASYVEGDDLTGKIAVLLRFEPMNEQGRSRLTDSGAWSAAASIAPKIQAAIDRGAAGVIVVSPPGAADERAARMEMPATTANWTRPLSVPAVMMSREAADRVLRAADGAGRGLAEFRALADRAREEGDRSSRVAALGGGKVSMTTNVARVPRTTWNVGGVLPGRGELKDEWVIVGAHFDHVGYGHTGGSRSGEFGVIHPGADDNASGTAGVLLAAKILKREYAAAEAAGDARPRRSVMFLGFSAEEMGLIGSREFIKASPMSASAVYAMLNMDMIGRIREGKLTVEGVGTAEGFADLLQPMFTASGLEVETVALGDGRSDHASFYGASIPVLQFFSGFHDEYHTPRDTADLINFEDAMTVVRTVCDVTRVLAERAEPLKFTSVSTRSARRMVRDRDAAPASPEAADSPAPMTARVRLGIRPEYAEDGQGVKAGEVTDGTSAAEAGIVAGDILIKWNADVLADSGDLMNKLREHKPGDIVNITIRRDGEERVIPVTLKSRDQAAK